MAALAQMAATTAALSSLQTISSPAKRTASKSSFLGDCSKLAVPVAGHRAASGATTQVVKAQCRPGWGGVQYRQGYGRNMWQQAFAAQQARRRCSSRANFVSPWGAFDYTPAGFMMGPFGFPMRPQQMAGIGQFLEMFMRELPRGMGLRRWDVQDMQDRWQLSIELPGFSAEDVKVQVEDNKFLVIRAQQKAEQKSESQEQQQWQSWARQASQLQTRLPLPDTIKADGISAELKQGVLRINLPKVVKEERKKNVVDVEVKETAAQVDDVKVEEPSTENGHDNEIKHDDPEMGGGINM